MDVSISEIIILKNYLIDFYVGFCKITRVAGVRLLAIKIFDPTCRKKVKSLNIFIFYLI